MSELNNENNQDLDSKIAAAMEKIVQETTGHIPENQPSPPDTSKAQKHNGAKDRNREKKNSQVIHKEQPYNINEKKNKPASRGRQNVQHKKNTKNAAQNKKADTADKSKNAAQNKKEDIANNQQNVIQNKKADKTKNQQNAAKNKNVDTANNQQNVAKSKNAAFKKKQMASQSEVAVTSQKPHDKNGAAAVKNRKNVNLEQQNQKESGSKKQQNQKENGSKKQQSENKNNTTGSGGQPQDMAKKSNGGQFKIQQFPAKGNAVNQQQKAEKIPKVQSINDNAGGNRTVKKGLRILGILAGLAIMCAYAGVAYYYHDKFMPGTRINNIDCKSMSVEDAEARIKEKVEDYSIKLVFREDKNQSIKGSDINFQYVSDGSVERLLKEQNSFLWLLGYIKKFNYEVAESIRFDDDKLKAKYDALECLQTEAQIAPENAFVNFQNGHFEIVPEIEGTTIDSSVFLAAVKGAISMSERELEAEKAGAYVQPEIRSDNEALEVEQNELNALGTPSIVYQLPQGEEVLNGNVTRHWLVRDEQGHYTKDEAIFEERLIEYVATLAERTDTVAKERPFTMTGGREITVSGGSYGWKINQTEEVATLKQNIANNDQITREPIYSSREVTTENNGFGNTYIEINLGDQHLYYYVEGEIVVESDFVSGRMTKSRYTPPGIFNLYYKQKDRVLRGTQRADGTYEYESHVNFWMPFNRGIGLHDASWRGSYGGTIYKYSGSHGCINMPYAKAQAVYELIDKEVPIICYYPDGYSLY